MYELFGLALLAGVAWWCYKHGKRLGSRQGYHVGRARGRRRRSRRAARRK